MAQRFLGGIILAEGRSFFVCDDREGAALRSMRASRFVLLPREGCSNSWDVRNIVEARTNLAGRVGHGTLGSSCIVFGNAFKLKVQFGETLLRLWALMLDV